MTTLIVLWLWDISVHVLVCVCGFTIWCDAGDSIVSWVLGWCWNWLKFNSSVTCTLPSLVSVQPIWLSKIWYYRNWIWLVKIHFLPMTFAMLTMLALSASYCELAWCGSWHPYTITLLHITGYWILNMYYIIVTVILASKSCVHVWHYKLCGRIPYDNCLFC